MPRPRKLTDEEVDAIIDARRERKALLAAAALLSAPALARKYRVSRALIHEVSAHGHGWRARRKAVGAIRIAKSIRGGLTKGESECLEYT